VASEVPELLAALPHRPPPDPVALAHWLELTGAPGGATLFAGINRLEAAHYLTLGAGGRAPRRYWSPSYRPPLRSPRAELALQLRGALELSLQRRLGDGQPAGVLLSGGLDSSAVAALGGRVQPGLHAYSAVFPAHAGVDESALIDRTVAHLGLGCTRLAVSGGSVVGGALAHLFAWQLPPVSPNVFFWTPLLERARTDGRRVILDGEGGDELFGLSPYLLTDRLRGGALLSAAGLAARFPGSAGGLSRGALRRLRHFGGKGAMPPAAHVLMRRARGIEAYRLPWIPPGLARARLAGDESAFAWKRLPGPRWWAYLVDAVTRGAASAQGYEEARRRAALSGLQARHPLVDVGVIELILQIPPEVAYDSRHSRPLLRESLAGLLPEEVRLRPAKSYFDALIGDVLAGPDLALVRRLLGDRGAELGAYIDMDSVRRLLLLSEPPADRFGRQRWVIAVWRLLTAECWLRSQSSDSFLQELSEQAARPGSDLAF
jgi:asparagine synthase (glutamine-hydrolysing)